MCDPLYHPCTVSPQSTQCQPIKRHSSVRPSVNVKQSHSPHNIVTSRVSSQNLTEQAKIIRNLLRTSNLHYYYYCCFLLLTLFIKNQPRLTLKITALGYLFPILRPPTSSEHVERYVHNPISKISNICAKHTHISYFSLLISLPFKNCIAPHIMCSYTNTYCYKYDHHRKWDNNNNNDANDSIAIAIIIQASYDW